MLSFLPKAFFSALLDKIPSWTRGILSFIGLKKQHKELRRSGEKLEETNNLDDLEDFESKLNS